LLENAEKYYTRTLVSHPIGHLANKMDIAQQLQITPNQLQLQYFTYNYNYLQNLN